MKSVCKLSSILIIFFMSCTDGIRENKMSADNNEKIEKILSTPMIKECFQNGSDKGKGEEFFRNCLKMYEYTVLKGVQYEILISESEALELGVTKDFYIDYKKNIEDNNRELLEMIKNGSSVELVDYQKVVKSLAKYGEITPDCYVRINEKDYSKDSLSFHSMMKVLPPPPSVAEHKTCGTINCNGQSIEKDYFMTQRYQKGVEFRCIALWTPAPIYHVYAKSGGVQYDDGGVGVGEIPRTFKATLALVG